MQLNDITIYQNVEWHMPHFREIIEPSKKTVSFLTKLIKDDYFLNKVIELRIKYSIPQEGFQSKLLKKYKHPTVSYSIKRYNGDYDIQPLREKMANDVEEIVKHYNLDFFYKWNLFLLVTHNSFIETQPNDLMAIKFAGDEDEIKMFLDVYKDPVGAIFLLNNITKTKLKKWIDENWDNDSWQSLRYHMPIIPQEKGTYLNASIDAEIAKLKDSGKSYQEIADELSAKYPENNNIDGLEWLKGRYSRYKKKKLH